MNELAVIEESSRNLITHSEADLELFVTFEIDGQMFGLPVRQVQDILKLDDIVVLDIDALLPKGTYDAVRRQPSTIWMLRRRDRSARRPRRPV